MEECALSFTDDTDTHCDYSISDQTSGTENISAPIQILCQNIPPFTHKESMYTETPLAMHTYSIMISITKTRSHSETNILHCYNKNCKTHTGIYMTQ